MTSFNTQQMTRKDLLSVPKRKWDDILTNVRAVYVLPNGKKHESGYAMMDFVAEFYGTNEKIRFGGYCDDISFYGKHFRMDCLYPSRIIRIWNNYPFTVSEDISSINFEEEEKDV